MAAQRKGGGTTPNSAWMLAICSCFRAMKSMLLWCRAIADGGGSDESSDHHRRVCVHARKIPRSLAH